MAVMTLRGLGLLLSVEHAHLCHSAWIIFYGVREEYSGTDARVTQWQSAAGFCLHCTVHTGR